MEPPTLEYRTAPAPAKPTADDGLRVREPRLDAQVDSSQGGSSWLVWLFVLLVLGTLGYIGLRLYKAQSAAPLARAQPPVPVLTAAARKGDMRIYLTGLGSVAPLNAVTLRTRVDGQVMAVSFTEGKMVKQDEPLVEIDPRPYQVQLQQGQGQLAKDKATLANARLDLQRYKSAPGSFTQQQIDTQQSVVDQAEAAVEIDQATIASAQLNLSYCHITSPLTGRIGLRNVDPGNIVHATDTSGLAVVSQIQPIALLFSLPEDNIPQVQKAIGATPTLEVDAFSRDMKTKIAQGTLLAFDNQVDPTTGTLRFKAEFKNDDFRLFPNQFVNARLLVDTLHEVTMVPSAAIQHSPTTTFVYVVKPSTDANGKDAGAYAPSAAKDQGAVKDPGAATDASGSKNGKPDGASRPGGVVEMRQVSTGPSEADDTVITDGISPGEIVVTDGVDKLQQGSKVTITQPPPTAGAAADGQGQPGQKGRHHRDGQNAASQPASTTSPTTRP